MNIALEQIINGMPCAKFITQIIRIKNIKFQIIFRGFRKGCLYLNMTGLVSGFTHQLFLIYFRPIVYIERASFSKWLKQLAVSPLQLIIYLPSWFYWRIILR